MKRIIIIIGLVAISAPALARREHAGRGPASGPPAGMREIQEKCNAAAEFILPTLSVPGEGSDREAMRAAMEANREAMDNYISGYVTGHISNDNESVQSCLAVLPPQAVCANICDFPARLEFTPGQRPDRSAMESMRSQMETALSCTESLPSEVNAIANYPNQACKASAAHFQQQMAAHRPQGGQQRGLQGRRGQGGFNAPAN